MTASQGQEDMADKKLLAIAEIARDLELPESTLHYWKNRFAPYLPSVGRNRQKRFKPEAVDVFRLIAQRLRSGHPSQDIMTELSHRYPVNAEPSFNAPAETLPTGPQRVQQTPAEIGAAIGTEIAKALAETLQTLAANLQPKAALPSQAMEEHSRAIKEQGERVETLKTENQDLRSKLSVLEAELVRLRKDRREMEKFLLDKIKKITS
ncbi:MAG: MerR family transcriptional regulator [Desulfovibrionaceae bacterium]|jgi:DNA-binding transcriptional MerR regulator